MKKIISKNKTNRIICILGGMGPGASVYLYKMLVDFAIEKFDAKNNNDFPEIIIQSIPVPDFISNENEKEVALEMLKERVENLNKIPVSYLTIACNTAHLLLDDLQKVSRVPFISIIDEVTEAIKKDNRKRVGLLGTPSLLNSKLYQDSLKDADINIIIPKSAHVELLDDIIRRIINNAAIPEDVSILSAIADDLCLNGAEAIILGCTELPQIFQSEYKIPVYNSVEILVMKLLSLYYEKDEIGAVDINSTGKNERVKKENIFLNRLQI